LLGIRASAHIEEVGRHTARVLDDVHGGHGEAGAVHHATHGSIQLDVIEVVLRSFDFQRIFFRRIAQGLDVGMTKERVVVEIHFRVQRKKPAIRATDKGIDFH
jgi:hypothetical protein